MLGFPSIDISFCLHGLFLSLLSQSMEEWCLGLAIWPCYRVVQIDFHSLHTRAPSLHQTTFSFLYQTFCTYFSFLIAASVSTIHTSSFPSSPQLSFTWVMKSHIQLHSSTRSKVRTLFIGGRSITSVSHGLWSKHTTANGGDARWSIAPERRGLW